MESKKVHQRLRIVQITRRFPPAIGGLETHVYEISKELARRGHKVTVLTMDSIEKDKHSSKLASSPNNFEVIRCRPDFQVKGYEVSSSMLKLLLTIPADLFHAHDYSVFSSDAAAFSVKLRKTPLVLTSHSFFEPIYPLSKLMMKLYNPLVWRFTAFSASKCIALTTEQSNIWQKMGVPKNRIEVVPNGVNLDDYSVPEIAKNNIKDNHLDGEIICFVGTLIDRKAIALLPFLIAFKEIKSEYPKTKLMIIGQDGYPHGYLTKLKEKVDELGLRNSVVFTGKVSERKKIMLMSASSIGLVLSTREALPLTCLEFMSLGKPIIASKVGGIPYVIENGYNGLLVDNNPNSMKNSLRKLLSDPSFAGSLGNNGKQLVLSKYNWKSVVDKLEKIYDDAVSCKQLKIKQRAG